VYFINSYAYCADMTGFHILVNPSLISQIAQHLVTWPHLLTTFQITALYAQQP